MDAGDWAAISAAVSDEGGALLPRLLTPTEARRLRKLFAEDELFRSTVDMAPRRYGSGQYRYFRAPYPEAIEQLKQALYPRLLPIARDWWAKLGREAPWPDNLDEWLDICHAAGQARSTALMLKYGSDDWNALHRDLYGDLVFPLQVVINLSDPDTEFTGGEFMLVEQRAAGPITRHSNAIGAGPRLPVHHPRPAGAIGSRVVSRRGAPRPVRGAVRRAVRARVDLSRRRLGRISPPIR